MSSPLRILHFEDNGVDAALAREMLEADGLVCEIMHVESGDAFAAALAASRFDLILSDFSLPSHGGHSALQHARETAPDTPMLFFSGTPGEEAVITALKDGATDYVLKQRPARLPSAVRQALTEVEQRVARRRAEDQFRAAVESAPAGLVMVNRTGAIVLVNKRVESLFGYGRAELLGQPIEQLVPSLFLGRPDGDRDAFFAAPTTRAIGERRDLTGRRNDGTEFPVEVGLSPVETTDDVLVMASIVDITERRILEEQFRQAQKMEAIGQLTGGVAHDFNNLLTVINCYAQLTLDALGPDSPIRPDVAEIQHAGERAALLTRQLLAFSRKQVLEPRVLDLNTLVTDIETMLRRVVTEDIKLRLVLEPELGTVRADPTQMEQVIMNLVVNARDAMPAGGVLLIKTANVELDGRMSGDAPSNMSGPFVNLSVTDTGLGMDEQTKQHIFEPFFTTKDIGRGTGLGLATVYGIVQQSSGSIAVSSAVGKGTTFTVFLPRIDQDADATLAGEQPATILQGTETILLVEDDSPLRTLAQTILRSNGYRVLTAANRDEALVSCRTFGGEIHLMVTDVVLPGMSGPEFSGVLADVRPRMKTLYMSGYTDDTITRRGVLIEGVAFLQKPFTAQRLLKKVRQALAR